MDNEYIDKLKQIPIVNVLQDIYGITPKKKGERYFCKIRPERTESCCIYPTNTYYDFGDSSGGNVINLVCSLSQCDAKAAMEKLSEYSGIRRKKTEKDRKILSDWEWRQLGIYPDKVSKNLNINVMFSESDRPSRLADINLRVYDCEETSSFENKYYISVEAFRSSRPKEYHSFLKSKVMLPMLSQRDEYYGDVLHRYNFARAIEPSDAFAKHVVFADDDLSKDADRLNKNSALLLRAVDDTNLLKFRRLELDPKKDIFKILNGDIAVQTSKISCFELCRLAVKQKNSVVKIKMPYDIYAVEYADSGSELHKIPHCGYYNAGECVMSFMSDSRQKVRKIFGEDIKDDEKVVELPSKNDGKSPVCKDDFCR